MATPSEIQAMKRCTCCQVLKPTTEFVIFGFGKRAGKVGSSCISCWLKSQYPPIRCVVCNILRPTSEFDKSAEGGTVCRACLVQRPNIYHKKCTQCGEVRLLARFSKQGRTHYRQPTCKVCDTKRTIEKNRRNPVVVARRRKNHSEKAKARVFRAYGGPICACCGETEPSFLTLDHINNDGAEWRRTHFGSNKLSGAAGLRTYMWCKKHGYPPIFQVLCWNCQQGKRFNGGICPHRKETCNDYSRVEVGASAPKRSASLVDGDIVWSSPKGEQVSLAN